MSSISPAQHIGQEVWTALGGAGPATEIEWVGTGDLPSIFPVTELAAASIGRDLENLEIGQQLAASAQDG